jgi:hypothetical protein
MPPKVCYAQETLGMTLKQLLRFTGGSGNIPSNFILDRQQLLQVHMH